MKKKILIALIVVLALSISVLAGCNLSIMSIELKSGTLATVYYVGDTVDMNKAKITVTKSDGTTEDVALTSAMLDKAITTTEAGKTTYTITYENKTCTFEVEVKLPTLSIKTGTLNTNYYVGDEVSYNGAKIVVKNGDATGVDVDLTAAMVSPAISTDKAGTTTHTITYNGATTTFEVTVSAPVISLVDGSLKLEYLVGDTVDLSNAKISVKCGTRPEVQVGFDKVTLDKEITTTATGKTTYTVSYNGATTTFEVIVRQVAEITSVSLDDEFIKDQQVSLDGVTLTVKYTDDTTGEVALTWDMIYAMIDGQVAASHATSIDTTLGADDAEKTLKYVVKYGGKSKEIEITVKNIPVKSIAVSSEFATDYYIGYATPNFASNHLVVTLDNEAESVRRIALTNAEFSPALPKTFTAGTYTYTLTYREKTTSLTINVYDVELQLVESNTTYYVGDDIFDNANKLIGYKIKVVATDGTVREDNLDVTRTMVTTLFSTETAGGDKTLVIEYKGKSLPIDNIVVNPVTISLATGDDAMTTKFVQGSTPAYTGKIVITYTPTRTKTVDITSAMFAENPITTTELGEKEYTLSYLGATTTVIVKIVPATKTDINTFVMPDGIKNYMSVSKAEDVADGNFKVNNVMYEVGNANKFILVPKIANQGTSIDGEVRVVATIKVSGTANGTYTELTASQLKEFVTIDGNSYKFDSGLSSIGEYVELTIVPDPDFYNAANVLPLSLKFVIVDNGYNVYDQMGLAAMNDLAKPELWADILGCDVSDGEYVEKVGTTPVQLDADDQALYKYIGNIDWIILHNGITLDADLLPAGYFWTRDNEQWNTAYDSLAGCDNAAELRAELEGSLYDGNGHNLYVSVAKDNLDSNNNKGLYQTAKVNISGNYNSIKVPATKSESGRQLRVVVHKEIAAYPKMRSAQWHVFKLDERLYANNRMDFVVKNTAFLGNTGHNESDGPQGLTLLENASKTITLENIVAQGFYNALSLDNFFGEVVDGPVMTISNTKIYDIFSSMVYTWRGNVTVVNSMLKNTGGPIFIMADGDTRNQTDNTLQAIPTVNVDAASYLEANAEGTEAWYMQLGDAVPVLFNYIRAFNEKFKEEFNLNFFTEEQKSDGKHTYANVKTIMIPDTGHALGSADFNRYMIQADYNMPNGDTFSMNDPVFKQMAMAMWQNPNKAQAGTVFFKSGNNYAMVSGQQVVDGNVVVELASPIMAYKLATMGDAYTAEQQQADYVAWMTGWKTNTSDTLGIWMQADTGATTCPYLGIVIGGLTNLNAAN